MRQKSPQAMKWVKKSPKQHEYKTNDHIELLREEQTAGPKRPNKHESNNIMAGTVKWYDKKWQQDYERSKEQAKGRKVHNQARPNP